MNRKSISSGSPYENEVGFCRAVRIGNTIEIAGTAPIKDGATLQGSVYEQSMRCFEIIEEALVAAGASLNDVVRTRMFVTDISAWEEVGRAHGAYFADIKPVSTMVEVSALIDPDMKVEIEATAIVSQ